MWLITSRQNSLESEKLLGQKREKHKIRANKNRKRKKEKQKSAKRKKKETRNLQRIIMMNVVRPQNWSAKSQCACVCICACVCLCVRGVCSLFTLLLRHAWPRARTNFLLLPQLPPYYARENQPHQTPTPKSHHPQLSPTQLNSTVNREQHQTQVESRVLCLVPRLSFHHHPWQWLAASTGSKNMKTLPQIHNAPKKQQAEFALYFGGVLEELIPCKRA